MTEPRLHLLARQAASRIALGHDPAAVVLSALCELSGAYPLGGVYDQLPPKAKAICVAMWGEKPMRAVDVYRLIGGSLAAIRKILYRLVLAGYVRVARYAHYAIQCPGLRPVVVKPLSVYRPKDPRQEALRMRHRLYAARRRMQRKGAA